MYKLIFIYEEIDVNFLFVALKKCLWKGWLI